MSATAAPLARPEPVEVLPPGRARADLLGVLRRDPPAMIGLTLIAVFLLTALAAPWLAPCPAEGYGAADAGTLTLPPSAAHPFGTDDLGRDVLSRMIIGVRPTLLVPFLVVALAVCIGAPLGAIAGYRGGWTDRIIMRVTDLQRDLTGGE